MLLLARVADLPGGVLGVGAVAGLQRQVAALGQRRVELLARLAVEVAGEDDGSAAADCLQPPEDVLALLQPEGGPQLPELGLEVGRGHHQLLPRLPAAEDGTENHLSIKSLSA